MLGGQAKGTVNMYQVPASPPVSFIGDLKKGEGRLAFSFFYVLIPTQMGGMNPGFPDTLFPIDAIKRQAYY